MREYVRSYIAWQTFHERLMGNDSVQTEDVGVVRDSSGLV